MELDGAGLGPGSILAQLWGSGLMSWISDLSSVQRERQFNLMDCGDGLRAGSQVGNQVQASRAKVQGGLDQGQSQDSGAAEGPGWGTSRKAWAVGPGPESGE